MYKLALCDISVHLSVVCLHVVDWPLSESELEARVDSILTQVSIFIP